MHDSETDEQCETAHRVFDRSPLRWAGSKRGLAVELLARLPKFSGRYIEPFAGGANLFFALKPALAILGDVNDDLINFYTVLKLQCSALLQRLSRLRASRRLYYRFRSSKPRSPLAKAVRFAYLNRLCWNGLYRVNQRGEFNVPIGNRLPEILWNVRRFRTASITLRNADLVTGDFEHTLKNADNGDLVFFDPPYPRGARLQDAFNRYSSSMWRRDDHIRLSRVAIELAERRANVIVVLGGQKEILNLYPPSFKRSTMTTSALISCNGAARRKVREVVLTNVLER